MSPKNPNDNIDTALGALVNALEVEPTGEEIQLGVDEKVSDPNIEITETVEGGADVNFDPNAPIDTANIPHDDNLAEYIDETDLRRFAIDLISDFETDKESRKDWEDTYVKGLDMLGFKDEDRTQPFEGASGSFTPYSLNL